VAVFLDFFLNAFLVEGRVLLGGVVGRLRFTTGLV